MDAFITHFKNLLGVGKGNIDASVFSSMNGHALDEEDRETLTRPITDKEIREAMFSFDPSKIPRPDGFEAHFYQQAWGTVGSDVIVAIKHCFVKNNMHSSVKATNVCLIPKVQCLVDLTDFRPIAYNNVFFKCFSKVLATRLKPILPKIISPP